MAKSSRPTGQGAQDEGDDEQDRERDKHDARHAEKLGARDVEPGLRYLIGADLLAAGPEAVEAAEDRKRAQRHDDGRDAPSRDDQPVEEAAGEADTGGERQPQEDVEIADGPAASPPRRRPKGR